LPRSLELRLSVFWRTAAPRRRRGRSCGGCP
jgi:hypothetical protein